jgi:predicted nuclease with TOPRIM domain
MNEKCQDCKTTIECEQLKQDVENLKDKVSNLETKVSNVITDQAVNKEQTKMVFNILNEIKGTITTIAEKLDKLEKRPGQKWDELIKILMAAGIGALLGNIKF